MFESFLKQHAAAAWTRTLDALALSMHDVDRDATRVWFHLFPLTLADAVEHAADLPALETQLELDGIYRLSDQIDSSHWFLYGHRYWPQMKGAILNAVDARSAPASLELDAIVRDLAATVAGSTNADRSLLLGIAAVGLMTLQQVGAAAFRHASTPIAPPTGLLAKIPEQIVAARRRDDGQGLFGMFRGVRNQYTVRFDERRDSGRFTVINGQHLTSASALDHRDYAGSPRRCQEGPIPIRCKSGSCGSCWVGVLGGADKLSPVEPLEARAMKIFGYLNSSEPRPLVRLACQATASGNITIVIPPWQGVLGKLAPASLGLNRLGEVRL